MTVLPVLTPLPLKGPLDYEAPEPLAPGTFVVVTVSGRETVAVIWDGEPEGKASKLKPIERVLDLPRMPESMRRFIDRAAHYTVNPPGMFLRLATEGTRTVLRRGTSEPSPLTEPRQRALRLAEETPGLSTSELAREAGVSAGVIKGLVEANALTQFTARKDGPPPKLDPDHAPATLNAEQLAAADAIRDAIAARQYKALLLDGVTGSGKTETYLETVADVINRIDRRFHCPSSPPLWRAARRVAL